MQITATVVAVVVALLLSTDVPPLHETIVVTAERLEQPAQESAAAISVLRRDDLIRLPAQHLGDALRLIPGLQLISVNPGAPPMISSRGFFGAGEVEYMQLLVDGVAVGDVESGLSDWRALPIETIDRIEVVRGPGSSLFGDTALGGVVQVFRRPTSHASLSIGSFDSRLSAAYATDHLGVYGNAARSSGFRDHGTAREFFGGATFTRGAWSTSLDLSSRDRDDPGSRSAEELAEDRFGSNELFQSDGENTSRIRASVRYRGVVDVTAHAQRRDSEQARTLLLAPGFGDRALRDLQTNGSGISVFKTLQRGDRRIAFGVEGGYDSISSTYNQSLRGDGSRARAAAFLTAEWRVLPRLRIAAGGRWDGIADRFENDKKDDRAFSPRLGLSLDLGAITSYLQLSRAFKAPTLDQRFDQRPFPDFAGGTFTISNPALSAQRANNVEVGLRGEWWEVVGYEMHVEDEIDFDLRTFRYANIGSSRHRGVEAMIAPTRSARLSYTWTRVEAEEGRQLKNIAEHVIRGDVDFRTIVDVHLAVEYSADRYLDDDNLFPLDDAAVVDLRIARSIGDLTASIDAKNLFDQQYEPLGFALTDFEGRSVPFYFPAAGRSIGLTLTWRKQ